MKKIVLLLSLISLCCNPSKRFINELQKLGRYNIRNAHIDSIDNSSYNLRVNSRNDGIFFILNISRDTSHIVTLIIDNEGNLMRVKSSELANAEIYYHYPGSRISYACFTTDMTLDTIGGRLIGIIRWKGYVFRFDKKGRLAAIYLCQNNMVLRDVFFVHEKYKKQGELISIKERKMTKREKKHIKKSNEKN